MTKDYAKRYNNISKEKKGKQRREPVKSKRHFFRWILLLLFGVAVLGFFLTGTPNHVFDDNKGKTVPKKSTTVIVSANKISAKKTDDNEPDFAFYTILPKEHIKVSTQAFYKEEYLLQLGTAKNPLDADRLKAKVALLGFEANVDIALLDDGVRLYKVDIGPYPSQDAAVADQKKLQEQHIQSLVIKKSN